MRRLLVCLALLCLSISAYAAHCDPNRSVCIVTFLDDSVPKRPLQIQATLSGKLKHVPFSRVIRTSIGDTITPLPDAFLKFDRLSFEITQIEGQSVRCRLALSPSRTSPGLYGFKLFFANGLYGCHAF